MAKLMVAVLTGLFVMGLSSVSFAGALDKAADATERANTMAKDAKATKDSAGQKSIEAKDASNQETGSLTDQAKDATKKTVNDKIDILGK